MQSENLKFFLINQMQSFASLLLNTLYDKRFVNQSVTFPENNVITSKCMNELLQLSSSALKNEHWALKGKLQAGLMSGSLFNSLGDYEQCLSGNTIYSVRGTKYCLASIDLSQDSQQLHLLTQQPKSVFELAGGRLAKLGLCVPDVCEERDISLLGNFMLRSSMSLTLSVQKVECILEETDQTSWQSSIGLWLSITLIVFAIAACTSSTILDSLGFSKNSKRSSFYKHSLEMFSLSRTYRRLMLKREMHIVPGGCSVDLRILDGLRVLSMFWIITIHSYNFGLQWLFFDNVRQVDNIYKTAKIQWLANGTFSVDNFFLISGVLGWFGSIKLNTKRFTPPKRKVSDESCSSQLQSSDVVREVIYQQTWRSVAFNVCFRYLRLIPIMMILILFSVNILPNLTYGPSWTSATTMFDRWCRRNWPLNLSMTHNLINMSNMCFSHSWYVASDFQLFLILQLLLLACSQFRSLQSKILASKWLLVAGIVISQSLVATVVNLYDLPSLPLVPTDSAQSINTYYALLYVKPYYWISSYFLGALLAICLTSLEWTARGRAAPCNWQIFLIQLSCLSLMTVLILSTFQHFKEGRRMSRLHSTLYALVARPLWSASIATILLFAALRCRYGRGKNILTKSIHNLLTCTIWLPLSRLTFSAYLLHPVIMAMFYGSRTESFQFSHSLLLYFTLGNIVLTYVGALAIYLFIESPIQVVLKRAKMSTAKSWLTNAPTSTLRPSFLGLVYQQSR